MDKLTKAQQELSELDSLASGDSLLHNLHPLAKLLTTILYIGLVVSFHKYQLSGLSVMVLYPVFLYQAAGIPISTCFRKLKLVMPLVCAVGIVNPFLDHTPMMLIGSFTVTGGMISMVSLMFKGIFSLMASFLLITTTPIDTICAALRMVHCPDILTTLLLLTYRYIGVMIREVSIMTEAYALRAPGQKGIHISAWGSFLGQLLLRSMDRAQELYSSMRLRGFNGDFFYADIPNFSLSSFIFALVSIIILILFRFIDIASLMGAMIAG